LYTTLENFQVGNTLYKEGDPPTKFYIIKSGQFALSKKVLVDDGGSKCLDKSKKNLKKPNPKY